MIVTGLDKHECFARWASWFGECANDYQLGAYDDSKRIRANYWWSAYRELSPAFPLTFEPEAKP